MNLSLTAIRSLITRFHRAESGAALTEFAITLPVYLFFTFGIINLYTIQQDKMISQARASSQLWTTAVEAQTSYNAAHIHPVSGAFVGQSNYYNPVGDTFSLMSGFDTVTSALGIHFEGATKAIAANAVPGFHTAVEPKVALSEVMDPESVAFCMVNDRIDEGVRNCANSPSGFFSAINSVLGGAGAYPGIAAGIRYGVIGAYDDEAYSSHELLDNNDPKARFNVMVSTSPEERILSVLMTRLAMTDYDPYEKFVAFGSGKADFSGAEGLDTPDLDQLTENAEQCAADAQRVGERMENCGNAICRARRRRDMRRVRRRCNNSGGAESIIGDAGNLGWDDIGSTTFP